jgi:putative transposase
MTEWLRKQGHPFNAKRVQRVWASAGLSLPQRRPRRKIRRDAPREKPAQKVNDVWAYDFVHDWCVNGQRLKCLVIIDESSRECLAIEVATSIDGNRVMGTLWRLFQRLGPPKFLRSDNGPEFICQAVTDWLAKIGTDTIFVEPGKPWQNGLVESFNARFRDECLNMELFLNRPDAINIIEGWRNQYNEEHLHSSLGYRTPAEVGRRVRAIDAFIENPTDLQHSPLEAVAH